MMIEAFNQGQLKNLYVPPPNSHKGQNGKLMVIGGSKLFHAASLWALEVASRIVDMVFYSSVPENNELVQKAKEEFRDGIVVPRDKLDQYIEEANCVLIGPGLPRPEGMEPGDDDTKEITESLIKKYPKKRWVIDGGSLQVMDASLLKTLNGNVIITPHEKEFEILFTHVIPNLFRDLKEDDNEMLKQVQHDTIKDIVSKVAKEYNVIVLLKGKEDIVCSTTKCVQITGGNAGMTKGGTGDVLAGLVAALACKNDLFLAACAGSFINKKAGDELYKSVGPYFNASDLANEIPRVMKALLTF